MKNIHRITSIERYRASANERRKYGGMTITIFLVEPLSDPSTWFKVTGYGPTPGDRKSDARRTAEAWLASNSVPAKAMWKS